MENEGQDYKEEEEEFNDDDEVSTIQGTNSKVSLLKSLFTNDAKSFSLRKDDDKDELVVKPAKDWKQISYDFLNCKNDLQPLGPLDSYSLLDTSRSEEFVAGQGTPNWGNLRRIVLDDSKDKKKRVRK